MVRKLIIISSLLLVGGTAYTYHYWLQLTKVPEWYQSENSSINQAINIKDTSDIQAAKTQITDKIQQQIQQSTPESNNSNNSVDIKLNEQEINQLLITNFVDHSNQKEILQVAKSIQTTVKDDTIEIGAAITPSQIPAESLTKSQKKVLDQAFNIFPQLKNQDVYIGIQGQPRAQNGRLIFDSNSKIKVGNVSLDINEISQRLGLSPGKIRQKLELELNQINIQDVDLNGSDVIFRVANF
ncbi:MAG: hypothetical protein QNJ55_05835 [Xenococcus sp. MO_188.B8]|nr:hypothetical protein [Xenococcus sp. MO_188.B8]